MLGEIIVFITEGECSEPQLISNIKKKFRFGETEIISFNTNIYALFQVLRKDDFQTDIIGVLCERNSDINERISSMGKDNISQVFLFFDYDGHDSQCDNEKIADMLKHFDNETENGKLYISYPMFEAVKDFVKDDDSCNRHCCLDISIGGGYKREVAKTTAYPDIRKLDAEAWSRIINFSIKKSCCIVNDIYDVLDYTVFSEQAGQADIFKKQVDKYIAPLKQVAVLSAFPLFLVDFFGESFYNRYLSVGNEVEKGECTYIKEAVLL